MELDYNIEKILDDLVRCGSLVDGSLPASKYRDIGEFSPTDIRRVFGSWNAGKERAGIQTIGGSNNQKYTPTVPKRHEMVQQIKSVCGCYRCGYNEFNSALQFHHINGGDKVDSIAQMVWGTYSWDAIKSEMKKCVILCSNCHAGVTNSGASYK